VPATVKASPLAKARLVLGVVSPKVVPIKEATRGQAGAAD
jgi:hypothetical protein